MVLTTRGISVMRLEEVEARLQELGWKSDAGIKLTLLEKKSVLRELIEKSQDKDKPQGAHNSLARKNKEELRQTCVELNIYLTGNETKPQITRKIKEKLKWTSTSEVLTDDTLANFGKYRGRTHEWIWNNDRDYCLWVTDTYVEEGDKCSPFLKKLAEYIESRRQQPPASSEKATSSSATGAASASSPVPLSVLQKTEEDPETEIEKLQQQLDEMKSQLSNRRRKTVTKDAQMLGTEC